MNKRELNIYATVTDRPSEIVWLNFLAPGLEGRENVPALVWLGLKERVSSEQMNVLINLRRQSKHPMKSLTMWGNNKKFGTAMEFIWKRARRGEGKSPQTTRKGQDWAG